MQQQACTRSSSVTTSLDHSGATKPISAAAVDDKLPQRDLSTLVSITVPRKGEQPRSLFKELSNAGSGVLYWYCGQLLRRGTYWGLMMNVVFLNISVLISLFL